MKFVLSIVALLPFAAISGNVYYVDPNGDDGNDGKSPESARQSLVEVMKLTTANNGDVVYAAEGTYLLKRDGNYRVKIPAGTKLIASGRRSETVIKGDSASDALLDASPWGCGPDAVGGVYLYSGAQLRGFTVTGCYGTAFDGTVAGGGVCGANRDDCVVYDCVITNNVGGKGAGVFSAVAIRCDVGCNTAAANANLCDSKAYSCYLHEENVPGDKYGYGYNKKCTLNGCTIRPKMVGSADAGVYGATCYNCYTMNERNNSTLGYTAYTSVGGSTVIGEGCFQVADADMVFDDRYRPVAGLNNGIDKGSYFLYTNGAPEVVLALLDKDFAGGPRLTGTEMDIGCGEMPLHPAAELSIVRPPTVALAAESGGAIVVSGGDEVSWRWTVPASTKVAVNYAFTVKMTGGAVAKVYFDDDETRSFSVVEADGVSPFGYAAVGTHTVRLVVIGEGCAMVSDVRCSDFGAHNWYVSPSGNNSNDGRTPETARRTLVSAMELARSGDVVHASRGTYDEGFSPTTAGDTTNRVWLTEGIGLVADEGKMVTFIVGRKPSEGGDVGADAIRCVAMASGAWLKGFSLVNGATAQNGSYKDYGGGVYWKTIGVGACVYDCIFDNCSAKRGGAGYGPLFVGCLFRSNCSGDNGTLSLYDCAGAIDCVFESSAYGQFTLVNCSTIDCVVKGNGEQEAYNCYFGMSGNANMTYHGCMVVGAQLEKAEELDEGYAPRFGSPLVDIGDINHYQTNFPSAWIQFSRNDFSGRLRVSNGLMDVGAGEHDYCEQFSDKLKAGHRVFSAEKASSCVRLANDGVVLTDGEALVGTLTMDREGKCEIRTEVTDGTLDIDLDGAPIVGQDGVFAFVCAPGGHRLSFAFAGAGSAKLLKIRGPASGLLLIFR